MTTENNFAMLLERAFVDLVVGRVKARGWKKGEFAAMVWPGDTPKAAAARWTATQQGIQYRKAPRRSDIRCPTYGGSTRGRP